MWDIFVIVFPPHHHTSIILGSILFNSGSDRTKVRLILNFWCVRFFQCQDSWKIRDWIKFNFFSSLLRSKAAHRRERHLMLIFWKIPQPNSRLTTAEYKNLFLYFCRQRGWSFASQWWLFHQKRKLPSFQLFLTYLRKKTYKKWRSQCGMFAVMYILEKCIKLRNWDFNANAKYLQSVCERFATFEYALEKNLIYFLKKWLDLNQIIHLWCSYEPCKMVVTLHGYRLKFYKHSICDENYFNIKIHCHGNNPKLKSKEPRCNCPKNTN